MLTFAFEKLCCEPIRVAPQQPVFVGTSTGRRFSPVGFNYDHDEFFRLIEDYWHEEWDKVARDFSSMRRLGANVVRIHLQFGKFVVSPGMASERELGQLDRVVELARELGLYLNIVGLSCYHDWDTPDWYRDMDVPDRWAQQAFFWDILAQRYAGEPAIFCFDLMNEPVVPGRQRDSGAWLGAEFAGKTYIQFIVLDGTTHARDEIALDWLKQVSRPVRERDPQRLVTVGLVDWSLPKSSIKSGFFPKIIAPCIDFISVHLYPESGRLDLCLKTLDGFCVGKPVVIDETFHLKCSVEEHIAFLEQAARRSQGFSTFYTDFFADNVNIERNQIMRNAHDIFRRSAPQFLRRA